MKLELVELHRLRLPLVAPFRTSFGTQVDRDVTLVRVVTSDAEGWGECVAMAAPLYSSEFLDSADEVIARWLVPALFDHGPVAAHQAARLWAPIQGHRMAKGALETAVLDAWLRGECESLRAFLGGEQDRVAVGVSVGIFDDVATLLESVDGYLDAGYRRIKLKIEPGWDAKIVAAVRDHVGDDVDLQVDAHAAYTRDDLDHLRALDEFGLLLVEQPLAADDLLGHSRLACTMDTPICLDESITSARLAVDAIELGAASIINIKAGRVGGYLEAKAVHDACAARGVPVWCGGMLESGIGRMDNRALSTLQNFVLPGDVSASKRYWQRDVIVPPVEVGPRGTVKLGEGAGLGVELDRDFIASITARKEELT